MDDDTSVGTAPLFREGLGEALVASDLYPEVRQRLEDYDRLRWAIPYIKWNVLEGAGWRLCAEEFSDNDEMDIWLDGDWEEGPVLTDKARAVIDAAQKGPIQARRRS
jgi:hypothetical protein